MWPAQEWFAQNVKTAKYMKRTYVGNGQKSDKKDKKATGSKAGKVASA